MADRNLDLALRVAGDASGGRNAIAALKRDLSGIGAGAARELDPLTKSMGEADRAAAGLQTRLKPLNAALGALGAAISVSALSGMVRGYAALSREIATLAGVANTSVEEFQGMAYAAQSVGVSQEKLGDIFKDTQDKVGDFLTTGGGELLDFFEKIAPKVGVTAEQFRNLSGPQALQLYVSSLEKASVSQAEMTFYLEAIADDSARLLPLLRDNGAAMADLSAEARALGAIIGADLVREGVALDRNLAQLEGRAKGLAIVIGSALVPKLNELAAGLLELARTDMSVFDRLFGTIFRGFDDPGKSPAEEIARLQEEIEKFKASDSLGRNFFGAIAPEKALADLEQQLAFWVAKREAAAAPTAKEQKGADERGRIEQQLVDEHARLENLRAVASGKANADILLDDRAMQKKRVQEAKAALSEQLRGVESLRDALRNAWQASVDGAKRAREDAASLKSQASAARQSGEDAAAGRRMQGMSEEARGAEAERRARDLTKQSGLDAARSVVKAYEGDLEAAAELAQKAADQADRAQQYVAQMPDDSDAASLLKELGDVRASALEAQARVKQQEASSLTETAAAQQSQIEEAEQQIAAIKLELEKPVSIELDITAAEAKIKALQAQLAGLSGQQPQPGARPGEGALDITATVDAETQEAEQDLAEVKGAVEAIPEEKTVVIKTVIDGTPTFGDAAGTWNAQQNADIPGRAYGGPLPGRAYGDRSDNMIYRGTPGEWVIQRPAVRYWGSSFMRAINEMRMPRFAYGGELGADQRATVAGMDGGAGKTPVVLQWPDGSRSPMSASDSVADQILGVFRRAALQRGRRK